MYVYGMKQIYPQLSLNPPKNAAAFLNKDSESTV